jgi:hypothetical protein
MNCDTDIPKLLARTSRLLMPISWRAFSTLEMKDLSRPLSATRSAWPQPRLCRKVRSRAPRRTQISTLCRLLGWPPAGFSLFTMPQACGLAMAGRVDSRPHGTMPVNFLRSPTTEGEAYTDRLLRQPNPCWSSSQGVGGPFQFHYGKIKAQPMPKHPLYSIHGRNQRHGVTHEQSNARSDRRPDCADLYCIRKQSGRHGNHANGAAVVMLRRSAAMPWLAGLSNQIRKYLSCQNLAASLQIGLHPLIAHSLRGTAQC